MIQTFFLLLLLSPLLYTVDNDPLREEEVLAVAAAATLFLSVSLLRRRAKITNASEMLIILMFSGLVVLQQFFIVKGSFVFGLKYAVVFCATFIPFWVARMLPLSGLHLRQSARVGIAALFVLTAVTIFTSYLFGVGEVHAQGASGVRAFGWLGDSFTPVIVFLVVYYFLQRRFLFAFLSLLTLLMTGGKAAMLMLIAIPAVLAFSNATRRVKIGACVVGVTCLFALISFGNAIVEYTAQTLIFEHSLNTRLLSIYNGLNYFTSSPWTGVGINQSMKFVETDSIGLANELGIESYYEVYQIHNPIVRTAAETGAAGLALLLIFLGLLLGQAYQNLRIGNHIADPIERAIVLAASVWVICFVLFYQTTGWFEAGHPQLSWLLAFATLSQVFARRQIVRDRLSDQELRPYAKPNSALHSA